MEKDRKEEPYGLVMVIGNGFDRNLGLPTSYQDYIKSKYWPFQNSKNEKKDDCDYGLGAYLNDIQYVDRWIDVEEQLHKYCSAKDPALQKYLNKDILSEEEKKKITGSSGITSKIEMDYRKTKLLEKDRKDYELLCSYFFNYLNFMDYSGIKPNYPAARLLSALSDKIDLLFTFNYTDINKAIDYLGCVPIDPGNIIYGHGSIHGESVARNNPSVENSTAILGIDDERPVLDNYRFMVKQYNENFYRVNSNTKGRSLNKALKNARNVIFFGLSFGENDFSYFKSFFEHIDELDVLESVTIFCYQDQQRLELLEHLAKIRQKDSTSVKFLQFNNDFQIITTGYSKRSEEKMEDFLYSIKLA